MPTLAQALQDPPPQPLPPRVITVVSSTAATIETSEGPVVNAIAATPQDGKVVVIHVDAVRYAVGWLRT
ncbi:hypothetical protein ACFVIM_21295 [Streptomyces sp. NPDC057638]|uniref:hypothetical protein n=1 Tax=Streptomyces sp. NPDC057638 TaxID=3346190 RepID=UPI0036808C13